MAFMIFPNTRESLTVVGRGVGLGTAFKRSGGYGAIGRLLVLVPDRRTDANFLTEYINHRVQIFFESGGIPQLTGISIAKYRIPLPPTQAEQKAIAEALSDADALIETIEQLLAKKHRLKQGVMQELLTGKKRLPGFGSEWKVKRLGEVATFHKGKGLPKSALEPFGAVPCIHYGELVTGQTLAFFLRCKMSLKADVPDF
jgi:type I restriction enzyme S subunit